MKFLRTFISRESSWCLYIRRNRSDVYENGDVAECDVFATTATLFASERLWMCSDDQSVCSSRYSAGKMDLENNAEKRSRPEEDHDWLASQSKARKKAKPSFFCSDVEQRSWPLIRLDILGGFGKLLVSLHADPPRSESEVSPSYDHLENNRFQMDSDDKLKEMAKE